MQNESYKYEEIKERAKNIYSKIGEIPSPALSGSVYFNSQGFNHLIRKGRKLRPKREQIRRFSLISHVEQIIRSSKIDLEFRKTESRVQINRHGEEILASKTILFWSFIKRKDGENIKVVIAQFGEKSKKIFLSVMS